ncbi:MAG: SPOR domain-containing protein [Gammaproteobacteria bacterium]
MKQRIMGLIILVAIALVFVPILFSRSGSSNPSNLQAKNPAPNLASAAAQPTIAQLSASAPPAPQQSPQATNTPASPTAPDDIVFQSPNQATEQPNTAATATSATNTENNTPAAATPSTPTDNANQAQNQQLVPVNPTISAEPPAASAQPQITGQANPTPSAEPPAVAAQPQLTEQSNATPSVATSSNTENNASAPNPAMAAITAPPPSTNNTNEVQKDQPGPYNPTVTMEQVPKVAPSNTTTSIPNNMSNEAAPITSQPTANNQPETTAPQSANKGIAASESGVLQGTQQQFQQSPRPKSESAHAATHHEKHHSPTHITQIQEKKSGTKEQGWIIQVGSFAEQKNVERLVQQLHAQGFVAQIKPIHTSHGTITRVYLGPEIQREQAERIAKQINEHFAIHSIVVPA